MEIQLPDISEVPELPPPDPELLNKLVALELPSQGQILNYVLSVGWLSAIMLVICGVVYLAYGWKIFKVLVIVNAGFVGVLVGAYLGAAYSNVHGGRHMVLIGGVTGAILLAAISWPLMKYAVSIMGGLAGSFLGYGLWHYLTTILDKPELNKHAWVGALFGLVVLGMFAFIIFRLTVIIFTSVQGAVMAVTGLLAMILKYQPITLELQNRLTTNPHLTPLLVAVPAIIGFAIQHTAAVKADKKKKLLAEKS
jgi:hypothetical protein